MVKSNIVDINKTKENLNKLLNQIPKEINTGKKQLLLNFTDEIKKMQEMKLSINRQLKLLKEAGMSVTFKTYKQFLNEINETGTPSPAGPSPDEAAQIKIKLKDGANKVYSQKEKIKLLGFSWNSEHKGWVGKGDEKTLVEIKKLGLEYIDI